MQQVTAWGRFWLGHTDGRCLRRRNAANCLAYRCRSWYNQQM
ncbi:hypothetical protein GTCCBUS3UF5_39000 [Geobacillus thermoleovorans CCB_US3_UF5]|uniref:Uncharacterized protein n=1 Tax=Geobacillus thermoleovorans CCB_US3_UF5 TaxID=1111068 RepID=A0ABM5MNV8_GEOTH|nr:hypothetical protein GTCCBUS3UF5_39000 [Geobacillus thermoleovorans CCB_US3_UF5]